MEHSSRGQDSAGFVKMPELPQPCPACRAAFHRWLSGEEVLKKHIDQYESIAMQKPGRFLRRHDEPFGDFSGVYEHTHDNGYVITTVPHVEGRCEKALRTCDGKCGS